VAGDSRQIFHTVDGTTWSQLKGIPDIFDTFGGIDVRGSRITFAGSTRDGYALYVSDDAGATFHTADTIRCPVICANLRGIASPRAGVVFVYGDGLLWRIVQR
jgi:hypothetical protein